MVLSKGLLNVEVEEDSKILIDALNGVSPTPCHLLTLDFQRPEVGVQIS